MYMPICCSILSTWDHIKERKAKFFMKQWTRIDITKIIIHEDYLLFYPVNHFEESHNNRDIDP